jgi:CpeT protein
MMRDRSIFIATVAVICAGLFCSFVTTEITPFERLRTYMSGNFSSELQSQRDSDYFDIRLRMVPIWMTTDTSFYLYVEQAMSTSMDKPYRQRIYKVVKESDTLFTSYIYTMNAPQRFVGLQGDDSAFKSITPDSLKVLDGCEVHLTYNSLSGKFEGSTGDKSCPSTRSGATHTTSKVSLSETGMISWDQGWNDQGKQVWGAEKGGYEFLRVK